jgi:hypothetical protein
MKKVRRSRSKSMACGEEKAAKKKRVFTIWLSLGSKEKLCMTPAKGCGWLVTRATNATPTRIIHSCEILVKS